MKKEKTRLQWFKEHSDYSKLLSHYEYGDCDEFVVDRYGDVVTYRVYGYSETTYKKFEI